jgi:hypothetical protein
MITCPHCNSSNVRRSESSSWYDFLRRFGDRQAFRCRACRQRFFASGGLQPKKQPAGKQRHRQKHPEPRKKARLLRRAITVGVYLLMLSAFGLLLRYLSVDHVRPDSEDTSSPSQ